MHWRWRPEQGGGLSGKAKGFQNLASPAFLALKVLQIYSPVAGFTRRCQAEFLMLGL